MWMRVVGRIALMLVVSGCRGPLAPSCNRQTGSVLDTGGTIAAAGTAAHSVASPRHSNLVMVLTWPDHSAALALRATLTACGDHAGCVVGLVSPGTGSAPGTMRLTVDGTRGKRYLVEVIGDAAREEAYTLRVNFDTGSCT
jgi:hypothetical protein